ncbi:hypothetical protein [Pseudomonas sp. F(2018)]|uniref:hypothetical protein n=1 Tax=Pseudomonas sp. F(2018) TaxID=2502240 RepID=UPI0010F4387E|nr:hypothetical protein [Pseudomonas sp. F(2018)]
MSWFVHARLGHYLQTEAPADGGQGGGNQPPATPPAEGGSLLSQGATTDFIPEKYRVNGADGALDLAQSSRKLAEAYGSLEKRLGSGDAPPKTHDEYAPKIEVEGFNWDEFKADEASQSFLKGAHAKGLTNAQVEFVIGEYLKAAPGLLEGNAVLSQQEATAALREVWKTDQDMQQNVKASYRAVQAFASEGDGIGSFNNLMAKYGNDPDFVAFAANIGRELNEDVPVNAGNPATDQDFAVKTSELRQQLQDLPAHDPKRPGIQAQLDAMYASRYNQPASRLNTKAPA